MSKQIKFNVLLSLVLILPILAAGCGPKATLGGYRDILEHYRGGHIDTLVAAWGAPDGQHVYVDGRKEYRFLKEYRQEYVDPPFYPGFGVGYYHRHFGIGGMYYPNRVSYRYSSCETRVITDKKGNIQEYYFRGNACRAVPAESDMKR